LFESDNCYNMIGLSRVNGISNIVLENQQLHQI